MIPDRYIWAAALAVARRFGDDAMLEASMRADELLDEGDWQRAIIPRQPIWGGKAAGVSKAMT